MEVCVCLGWCSGEPCALCSDPEAGLPLLSQCTGSLRSVAKPSYPLCVHVKDEETHPGYLPHDTVEKDSLGKMLFPPLLAGGSENMSCQVRAFLKQYRA